MGEKSSYPGSENRNLALVGKSTEAIEFARQILYPNRGKVQPLCFVLRSKTKGERSLMA
jgi:hypothetical protein